MKNNDKVNSVPSAKTMCLVNSHSAPSLTHSLKGCGQRSVGEGVRFVSFSSITRAECISYLELLSKIRVPTLARIREHILCKRTNSVYKSRMYLLYRALEQELGENVISDIELLRKSLELLHKEASLLRQGMRA